jgi:hypothetical protein
MTGAEPVYMVNLPIWMKATRSQRKCHNQETDNFNPFPNKIRMIKIEMMHVVGMGYGKCKQNFSQEI